jgi:hypothetical protein
MLEWTLTGIEHFGVFYPLNAPRNGNSILREAVFHEIVGAIPEPRADVDIRPKVKKAFLVEQTRVIRDAVPCEFGWGERGETEGFGERELERFAGVVKLTLKVHRRGFFFL